MNLFRNNSAAPQCVRLGFTTLILGLTAVGLGSPVYGVETWTLVGWNDLGMHCMDADYSVFSLLPPYNTIHAQLLDPQGQLVRDASGITVTYEAVADPDGSRNTTSGGKTNFWEHVEALFGAALTTDMGLAGHNMPGPGNVAQPLSFEPAMAWFTAEGIPITPYDDARTKNSYPLMHLVARDASGTVLATTDVVLPISDEMDCMACHSSGSNIAARPIAGWVNDPDPQRDMRLNILRLHDDREMFRDTFKNALTAAGYNAAGLFATATSDATPVLCARCHLSNALPGSGMSGISPLTQAVHRRMAFVTDPTNGLPLESSDNRSACYRCHPGSVTRCLRGAMGAAVSADGTLAMQCQSCHGSMTAVAATDRAGWLDEPACQSCHTGSAVHNNGQIRYTSIFEQDGSRRVAVDPTFATNPDTPAPGLTLYRFSTGHGGLQCEACHGSTHAEFPSSHRNDNIQSVQHQGHVGVLVECTTCHPTQPITVDGGPHGMHPVGQAWVQQHPDTAEEGGAVRCQACHGSDYRGTVLSRSQADRTLNSDLGTKHFWRGFQVGCYTCHLGPANEQANPNRAPVTSDDALATTVDSPVDIALHATDPDGDGLALRIVSQASHGTVGLTDATATYFPEAGFAGDDSFTFAASDGSTDSNLSTITVTVTAALVCTGDCDGDGTVTIDELIRGVSIALGSAPLDDCAACDANGDGHVTVDELIAAVNLALSGCAGVPAS